MKRPYDIQLSLETAKNEAVLRTVTVNVATDKTHALQHGAGKRDNP